MIRRSRKTSTLKSSDDAPGSLLTTTLFAALIATTWVITCMLQAIIMATFGMILPKHRWQLMTGSSFRSVQALCIKIHPRLSVRVTKDSWQFPPEVISGKKAVLVVCNHRSFFDPFALCAGLLPLETKYVAKGDLFNIPFGGWAMRAAGDLPVKFDPKNNGGWGTVKGSTGVLLQQAEDALLAGVSIAIFPEGTRMGYCSERTAEASAHPTKLMPFKLPFFQLAKKHNIPVVVCAMHGADEIWPVGSSMLRPGTTTLHVSEPIHGADYDTDEAFADAARSRCGHSYQHLFEDEQDQPHTHSHQKQVWPLE